MFSSWLSKLKYLDIGSTGSFYLYRPASNRLIGLVQQFVIPCTGNYPPASLNQLFPISMQLPTTFYRWWALAADYTQCISSYDVSDTRSLSTSKLYKPHKTNSCLYTLPNSMSIMFTSLTPQPQSFSHSFVTCSIVFFFDT